MTDIPALGPKAWLNEFVMNGEIPEKAYFASSEETYKFFKIPKIESGTQVTLH